MTLQVLTFRAGQLVDQSVHSDLDAAASAFWDAVLTIRREAVSYDTPCRAELWKDGSAVAIESVSGPSDQAISSIRKMAGASHPAASLKVTLH